MKTSTFFSVLFLLLGVGVLNADEPQRIAMVVSARGEVVVFSKEGVSRPGVMGSALLVGDRLVTKSGATIEVVFLDGSKLSLAGEGNLSVDDYAYGGKRKPTSVVTVRSGVFSFMAGKIAKIAPENYKVETTTATIGIRGSGGHGVVTSDGLTISTVPGHVLVVTTKTGEQYLLDDPSLTLKVDRLGRGILRGRPHRESPASDTRGVELFPYQPVVLNFRLRRGIKKVEGEDDMKEIKLADMIGVRDIGIARESNTPSSSRLMSRLGQELRTGRVKKTVSGKRPIKISKETGSARSTLSQVGLTQLKALERQFSNVSPTDNKTTKTT